MNRTMTCLLAAAVTGTAMLMAGAAAWDRGGTVLDRALLVALSVAIVAGAHLIPALSRRRVAWLLWAGCLLGALYADLTFLVHSSLRAGEVRAQHSALAQGTERQIAATQTALDAITARPIASVAAELALTSNSRARAALRVELAEGKRAEALRAELVRLSAVATDAQVTGTTDPVTERLADVTGYAGSTISVVVGLTFSLLLETLGSLLWLEVLRDQGANEAEDKSSGINDGSEAVAGATNCVTGNRTDEVMQLREAISAGTVKPTVSGIRVYLGCSQSRALELRRAMQ